MKRGTVLAVVVIAGAGLWMASHHHSDHGGSGYINPLEGQHWVLSRTDQGVDYKPVTPTPVRAIGAGTTCPGRNPAEENGGRMTRCRHCSQGDSDLTSLDLCSTTWTPASSSWARRSIFATTPKSPDI